MVVEQPHGDVRRSGTVAARRSRRAMARLLVGCVVVLLSVIGFAAPAEAVSKPSPNYTITKLNNNALQLSYGGKNYICYYGDLCVYRGGHYSTYYKCQTVSNSTTSNGWFVNNQTPGGTAKFYYTSSEYYGFGPSQRCWYLIQWKYYIKFRTC